MKKRLIIMVIVALSIVVSCVSGGGKTTSSKRKLNTKLNLKAMNADIFTKNQMILEAKDLSLALWSSVDDKAVWELRVREDGEYTVVVRYSCATDSMGSTVALTVGDASLEFQVKDTGEWSTYLVDEVGTLNLKAGKQEVVIQANKIANRFVCNLNNITFVKL